jgi:hypothetical protein
MIGRYGCGPRWKCEHTQRGCDRIKLGKCKVDAISRGLCFHAFFVPLVPQEYGGMELYGF